MKTTELKTERGQLIYKIMRHSKISTRVVMEEQERALERMTIENLRDYYEKMDKNFVNA